MKKSTKNKVSLFKDVSDGSYNYFSIEKITCNYIIDPQTYSTALELVNNGNANIIHCQFGYSDQYENNELVGAVKAIVNEKCVKMRFTRNQMLELFCYDYICNINRLYQRKRRKVCVHEAAALILVDRYIKENRPGDSTDIFGAMFMDTFRSQNDMNTAAMNENVELTPRITQYNNCLCIRVLISKKGLNKNYIVRNVSELLYMVDSGHIYPLGKNNKIDFSLETFSEETKPFYDFLNNLKKEMMSHLSGSYLRGDLSIELKSHIPLDGNALDKFFDIFAEQKIEYDIHKNTKLRLKVGEPKLTMELNKYVSNGVFEGLTLSGKLPLFYSGTEHSYCITDNHLYRLGEEFESKMAPLISLSEMQEEQIVSMHFGRKMIPEFYYGILPMLKQTMTIIEHDVEYIEDNLPPEAAFKFYMDIDDEHMPECRVETMYGNTGVAIFDNLDRTKVPEIFRNVYKEKSVLNVVMHYFPMFDGPNERFLAKNDNDTLYDIIENAVPALMSLGEVVSTERFSGIKIRPKLSISVGVSIDSDLLNLDISTDDISGKELLDIIKSYRKQKKYHRLKNGEFINIDESIEELSAMMDTMHISPKEFVKGKMQIPAYRALYLDKMLEQSQEIYAKRDSHYKQLIKNFKTVNESDFEIPEELNNTMRGYQRFGHKWLRTLEKCGFGGILADDMGLGKTLQMISVMAAAKEEKEQSTSLVVCPASLVYNWAAEFEKFAPTMSVCTIVGNQKERQSMIEQYKDYDVLITSYDLIKRDSASYEECQFNYQVLDEAQYIKNHTTIAAKSVKLINAKHKFALTGTPIENRLSELWSIFDYLMPGFLYGYETFKKEMETPIVKKGSEEASRRLKRMTSPFILRRLKQDVLRDLPQKLEEDHIVNMDKEQRHIYDGKVLELKNMLDSTGDSGFNTSKLQILAMLTQIRQICCDPSLLFADYKGESAKKEACMDIVHSAIEGEHKMLIFSQFTSMLELLEIELNKEKISYFKITGETSKKKRLEMVDQFNNSDIPVFLISLKAGGTGLNLTGADIVIHYDPWWNVAAQNQATDRAHRIGQTKAVTVYKLIAKNTIEEKIQNMQKKKRDLADSILSGENVDFASLSKDDLMDILG